jgi:hypothetical protein
MSPDGTIDGGKVTDTAAAVPGAGNPTPTSGTMGASNPEGATNTPYLPGVGQTGSNYDAANTFHRQVEGAPPVPGNTLPAQPGQVAQSAQPTAPAQPSINHKQESDGGDEAEAAREAAGRNAAKQKQNTAPKYSDPNDLTIPMGKSSAFVIGYRLALGKL